MKRVISLIFSLLFILSLFLISSPINAAYDEAWDEGYWYESHKEWFDFHMFNCTVIDKYYVHMSFEPRRDYAYYLIDADGAIGYFELKGGPDANKFKIGDQLTINGSMVDEPGNNHHLDSRIFGEKISEQAIPKIRFNQVKVSNNFKNGGSSSTTKLPSTDMEISKSTITNGNPKYDQTNCTVYVGEKYSGDKVHISVLYIKNGKKLNQGNIIPKNVSSSGKISVPTANPLKNYPEKALIIIYDENKKPIDAKVATLSKTSNAQNTKFNVGKSFKDCKNYFSDASDEVVANVMDECDSQGDAYLNESEFKKFKDLVEFTREHAANKKNHDKVNNVNKWLGKGTTKTRYCADHGRVAVGEDNKCPWCIKYGNNPATKSDSTEYVYDLKQI